MSRRRALKLALILGNRAKKKSSFYSDLGFYWPIVKACLLQNGLQKYAQSLKLLSILDRLEVSPEIRAYILSLPGDLQGIAVGQINKKKGITLAELEGAVRAFKEKEELKNKTKEDIGQELIGNEEHLTPPLRNWLIIQFRKYPQDKPWLIRYIPEISWFIDKYDIDLASYNAKTLIQAMHQTKFLNQDELSEIGIKNSPVDDFFHKVIEMEDRVLETVDSNAVRKWAGINFFRLRREWRQNIEAAMKRDNKSFPQILQEGKSIMDAQQAGQLRGQEMPETPLHNGEHALLMANLPYLSDWFYSTDGITNLNALNKLSLKEIVEASKKWHEEEAKNGSKGQYDPIEQSNIVYGPDNWKDEQNKGFFILELKSDNDLKVEGFKMNHCVGSYCEQKNSGQTRIFSLRNQSDPMQPILTIETDPTGSVIRQDYGPSNSKVDKKFHEMVDEWNQKSLSESGGIDLSKLTSRDIRKLVNKSTNPEFLRQVIEHAEKSNDTQYFEYVVRGCLYNPYVPDDLLNKYANYTDFQQDIVGNPSTPPSVLRAILKYNKEENVSIRNRDDILKEMLKRKNLSDQILNDLVDMGNETSVNVHSVILSKYPDRHNIIKHIYEKTDNKETKNMARVIMADSSEQIDNAISQSGYYNQKNDIFRDSQYQRLLLAAAKNPYLSELRMNEIANLVEDNYDTNKYARALLDNHKLSEKSLEILVKSENGPIILDILNLDYLPPRILHNIELLYRQGDLDINGIESALQSAKSRQTKTAALQPYRTIIPGETKLDEPPVSQAPISQDSRPIVGKDGSKRHYNSLGKLHRIGGPAVISSEGNQLYYQHGKLHREDGPATILFDGSSRWYINGEQLSPLEVLQLMIQKGRISPHHIDLLKEMADIAFFDYNKYDVNSIKHAGSILMEEGIIPTRNMHTIVEFLKAALKL